MTKELNEDCKRGELVGSSSPSIKTNKGFRVEERKLKLVTNELNKDNKGDEWVSANNSKPCCVRKMTQSFDAGAQSDKGVHDKRVLAEEAI